MNTPKFWNGRRRSFRPRFHFYGGLLAIGTLGAACDADFVDLRDPSASALSTQDAGTAPTDEDAGVVAEDAGSGGPVSVGVISEGTWQGRGSYSASGQATLERLDNGEVEVRFSSDFSASRVPGPVVVLTYRESIGTRIDPGQGDVELGRLVRNSGSQTYTVPAGADDRPFVWVYCKPFGLEVGRAALETPQ